MFNPAYIGVIIVGLLHGIEPSHGWPVAVLYSLRKQNVVAGAAISSAVIGAGHLVSSVAVVVAFVLVRQWLVLEASWIKYLAAAILLVMSIRLFTAKTDTVADQHGHIHEGILEAKHGHSHDHEEQGRHHHWHEHKAGGAMNLVRLASFAIVLGFAHEEEIVLLALVAGGLNAWLLITAYAASVMVGLIIATILGVTIYRRFERVLTRYQPYAPKVGAAMMLLMALAIVIF